MSPWQPAPQSRYPGPQPPVPHVTTVDPILCGAGRRCTGGGVSRTRPQVYGVGRDSALPSSCIRSRHLPRVTDAPGPGQPCTGSSWGATFSCRLVSAGLAGCRQQAATGGESPGSPVSVCLHLKRASHKTKMKAQFALAIQHHNFFKSCIKNKSSMTR